MATVLNSLRPGTELANILEQTWRPRFALEANEEMVIGRNFDGADGVTKIGNTLNISKIAVKSANNLSTTAQVDAGALTFETDTESNIAVTVRDDYSAVSLGRPGQARMLRSVDFQAGVKQQLMAALMTGIDVQCGALVPSLATNIVGSGVVNITKSLLLSAIGKLVASAKEKYKIGQTTAYLCVYSLQADDLLAIPDITAADVRGDRVNPNVTGRIWPAYGLEVGESGNISTSGGAAHNFLHVRESHVLAYNEEPNPLDPQMNGLAMLFIAFASYGVGEVFDEWAVDMQSQTT